MMARQGHTTRKHPSRIVFFVLAMSVTSRSRCLTSAFARGVPLTRRLGCQHVGTSSSCSSHVFQLDRNLCYRSDWSQRGGSQLNNSKEDETAVTTESVLPKRIESTTVPEESPPASIPGWKKRWRRRTGGVLSAVGFVTSSTRALLTMDRSQFQKQWKPMVDALGNFLEQSGIDLEISALLNVSTFLR